jgi:A/G-specific adenine glycosylase
MPAELPKKSLTDVLRRKIAAVPKAALRRDLTAWYRRSARDLPWRRTRDPWAIWVSEVMLQQTQVKTVIPFYPRFLERFPTPAALARARAPQVLSAWSGLGYYRRARHLHAAAGLVVREHAGRVPSDPEQFGRLPGVGRYTRAAVLSMGFGAKLAVLDGNVARVLARVFALPVAVRDLHGARELWAVAETLIPAQSPGDWNQALMELGALICTPRAPCCGECPVKRHCRALALGRVAEFPPATARRESVRVRRAVALISRGRRMLMVRREGALLDGLWEPPGVELSPREDARAKLGAELARLGVRATIESTREIVRHTITHRAIRVEVWRGSAATGAAAWAPEFAGGRAARFVDLRRARPSVPLTGLAIKLVRAGAR